MMERSTSSLALLASILLACEPAAVPIPGGGARGEPAAGAVIVFAIDERSGEPVEGARVVVAEASATTAPDGRATLAHAGTVDVTVSADGYLTETWLGVDASELTVTLAPSMPTEGGGIVRARLVGLDAYAPSNAANAVRAVLGVTRELSDDPTGDGAERAACSPGTECVHELEVGAALTAVFAQIDEVDASGRRVAPLGFAISEPAQVAQGDSVDVSLQPVDASRLRELSVDTPPAPSGIDAVVGVPGLSTSGRVIVLAGDEGSASFLLPAPASDETYWAVAAGASGTASSRSIARLSPGDSAGALAPPALRAPPGGSREAGGLRLSQVDGSAMITLTAPGWRTRVFDGRALVLLPDDSAVRVCAVDAERRSGEWHLEDLVNGWSRRACSDL